MESEVVKWIWTNLPTLSVMLILARVYVKATQIWLEQERRCKEHSALMHRLKNVLLSEFPKRAREILEGEKDD